MSSSGFDEIATTAARLFLTQGFRGVSVRAIATELGIQAASLYHHCPGGKAEIYVRSISWFLDGYAERLLAARGRSSFPESMLRMAAFTLGENHVDVRRIVLEDLPNLPKAEQSTLSETLHQALLRPFVEEFETAKQRGHARKRLDSQMAASCVLAIADNIGGLHLPSEGLPSSKELEAAKHLVRSGISLLIDGTGP